MYQDEFVKGQLWLSEYEPELGIGKVIETDFRSIDIEFINTKVKRKYSTKTAPLKRLVFKQGDNVNTKSGNSFIIEGLREENGLIIYKTKEKELFESEITEAFNFNLVEEKILSGVVSENNLFNLRHEILKFQAKLEKSHLKGFMGSRTQLIPHQMYIAQEVSSRTNPRVMMADEPGLGKTIEAGMIIHNLLLNEKISRVLILTPQSLVNQWFVEMARKFNLSFQIFDDEHLLNQERENDGSNPFEEYELAISNIEFLSNNDEYREFVLESEWDLLVVDEAHRLEVSEDEFEDTSPEYELVEELTFSSKGVLLLTATPEQKGLETYFGHLKLLDPDRFYSFESFRKGELLYKDISAIITKIQNKDNLDDKQKKLLSLYLDSKDIEAKLSQAKEDNLFMDHLINELVDRHGTGRVIFRNTRKIMENFPKRNVFNYPVKKENKKDPKIAIVADLLKKNKGEKFLLICESKEKVLQIEKELKETVFVKTALFHEGINLMARDRNAAYFREEDGADILLASEIGSEGRNFQFAHNLILFDLPLNAELIEQRIGRLDRIGQTHDINIHIPYIKGSEEETIFRVFHEGMGIFEEYVSGTSNIFAKFEYKIDVVAENGKGIDNLLKEIKDYKSKVIEDFENGRDRLLEINSFKPKVAEKLIEDINEREKSKDLENIMIQLFDYFGVEYEELKENVYAVLPADNMLVEHFPQVPMDGTTITYDRTIALQREDYKFITPDHPMVSGAIDLLLGSEGGNTAIASLSGVEKSDMAVEIIFVIDCMAPKFLQPSRFLPPIPLRVVVDKNHKLKDFSEDLLKNNLKDIDFNIFFKKEDVSQDTLKGIIEAGKKYLEKDFSEKVSQAKKEMKETLSYEIERIAYLSKVNPNVREEEMEFAQKRMSLLDHYISSSSLRVDSIRLITFK